MRGRNGDVRNIYTLRGFISRINKKTKISKSGIEPAIAKNVPTPAKDEDDLAFALLGLLKDISEDKLE